MESALSIKGQATIPKAIREHLHLVPGGRVKFFKHPDGTVVILPILPTSRLKGMASRRRLASLDEIDAGIAATVKARRKASRR
jgi:antitoxin PrlF